MYLKKKIMKKIKRPSSCQQTTNTLLDTLYFIHRPIVMSNQKQQKKYLDDYQSNFGFSGTS
jgi:hypothetical protein